MGLDIYLYKYENFEKTQQLEKEYEEKSEKLWAKEGKYETLTQDQKDKVSEKTKTLAAKMGLGKYGEDPAKQKIEMDSPIDPEHYFKIGYFRSSYNNGGINHILANLGVPDLYEIFQRQDEDYAFRPNWLDALNKCNEAIRLLETKRDIKAFEVSHNAFSASPPPCSSEKDALDIYLKEIEKEKMSDHYSNLNGHFFGDGIKVLALLPGTQDFLSRKIPCTYVVIEGENKWYLTALKIVKETIEYVLAQPDENKYYLHWSG